MEVVLGIVKEIGVVLLEMAPYLLFGFLLAGILKLLLPRELLYKHLSHRSFFSIVKASVLGVPLPLCSCGIIPVAGHLRKEGANKGAIISFLTSTPTTGVDSIFATYALMGPLFAIIRPVVAFVSGIFSGTLDYLLAPEAIASEPYNSSFSCVVCDEREEHKHSLAEKIKYVLSYAFVDLVEDLSKWLTIGIVISGIISGLIPSGIINSYLSNSFLSYSAMIVIGIPLYVCSTGSIPIAASLIKIGISPGAALIFLIVGPATNAATISFVGGKLGKRTLITYLLSITFVAVLSGLAMDFFWSSKEISMNIMHLHDDLIPFWLKLASTIFFVALLLNVVCQKYFTKKKSDSCCSSKGCNAHVKIEPVKVESTSCCHSKKSCCGDKE